jgi:hypothetical protein
VCIVLLVFVMYFNNGCIAFLPLLYLAGALGFYSIQPSLKCVRPTFSSHSFAYTPLFVCNNCDCNESNISQGEPYSNITLPEVSSGDVLLPSSQEPIEDPEFSPNLPYLNAQDKLILAAGGMIQKQHRDGHRGSGSVVVDIKCPPDIVFAALTQIAMYEYMIPIVKSCNILSSDGIDTLAEFTLTRILLRATVKHTVLQNQRILKFMLDKSQANHVVKEAEGFWHVQVPTDRPSGYSRVYLSAQVLADMMVPPMILDYAVSRALSRATKWLKPYFIEIMNE